MAWLFTLFGSNLYWILAQQKKTWPMADPWWTLSPISLSIAPKSNAAARSLKPLELVRTSARAILNSKNAATNLSNEAVASHKRAASHNFFGVGMATLYHQCLKPEVLRNISPPNFLSPVGTTSWNRMDVMLVSPLGLYPSFWHISNRALERRTVSVAAVQIDTGDDPEIALTYSGIDKIAVPGMTWKNKRFEDVSFGELLTQRNRHQMAESWPRYQFYNVKNETSNRQHRIQIWPAGIHQKLRAASLAERCLTPSVSDIS